jgi:7,8-dihydro-6-hydroxymethylpterin dimethyltransferase
VGWRNIIEKMHMTATLTKWYEEHGRHEIFAGGKQVGLASKDHTLNVIDEHVHAERNHTLDDLGIAKTAREEKIRARDSKNKGLDPKQVAENARMEALYRQHVLGEKPAPQGGFVPLGTIGGPNGGIAPAPSEKETDGVLGD